MLEFQLPPRVAARLLLAARVRLAEESGHAFHGNQYTTVFHGTTAEHLDNIRKQGLSTKAARLYQDLSRTDAVYVTTDRREAENWALTALRKKQMLRGPDFKAEAVVLAVQIPPEKIAKLTYDRNFGNYGNVGTEKEFRGDIPPEWIRHTWQLSKTQGEWKELESADGLIFVPLIIPDDSALKAAEEAGHAFHGNQYTKKSLPSEFTELFGPDKPKPVSPQDEVKRREALIAKVSKTFEKLAQPDSPVFYHGTVDKALSSIKEKGLVAKAGKGADEWAKQHGFPMYNWDAGDRPQSVFVTENQRDALMFAKYASSAVGGEPVVLKVNVPKEELPRLKPDEKFNGKGAFRYPDVIKPSWIEGRLEVKPVTEYSKVWGPAKTYVVGKKVTALAEGDLVLYLTFMALPEEPAALEEKGHEFHGNQWTPNAKNDVQPAFDFASQVGQYPKTGKPGIGYFKGKIDAKRYVNALLFRDETGQVRGVLNHYPQDILPYERKGKVNVMVDPTAQRQGIATKLYREADRRWNINPKQQSFTAEGRKFYTSLTKKPRNLEETGHPFHGNQWTENTPENVEHMRKAGTVIERLIQQYGADWLSHLTKYVSKGYTVDDLLQARALEEIGHDFHGNQWTKNALLVPTIRRAFNGERMPGERLTKNETGTLGEAITVQWLRDQGFTDARTLNIKGNNFPLDLVQGQHVFEVKTGLASNSPAAQQWRATIGEPGAREKAWLAKASDAAKARFNDRKEAAIIKRKETAVKEMSTRLGHPVRGRTVGVILDPETRVADIHIFNGFHKRIGWNSDEAKEGYVGSYKY